MAFPHEDAAFRDLLEAAAQPVGLPTSLVEKDYWVNPGEGPAWQALAKAHAEIGHMFWGPRIPLAEACKAIRAWVEASL